MEENLARATKYSFTLKGKTWLVFLTSTHFNLPSELISTTSIHSAMKKKILCTMRLYPCRRLHLNTKD